MDRDGNTEVWRHFCKPGDVMRGVENRRQAQLVFVGVHQEHLEQGNQHRQEKDNKKWYIVRNCRTENR